jgi:hypothetical protein
MALPIAARSSALILTIDGQDVSSVVSNSLQRLTYKENIDYTSDTVSITCGDPDAKFRLASPLQTGMPMTLEIISENWNYPGEVKQRACGIFYIHNVVFDLSKTGGSIVTIEATTVPLSPKTSIRHEKKSKGQDQTTLKTLAQQIATTNGLGLKYDAPKDPKIGRNDQHDQSDLVHLATHCRENDLVLKIKDKTLTISSHEQLEKQGPVGVIVCPTRSSPGGINGAGIINARLEENLEDCVGACEVAYKDNKTGQVIRGQQVDPTLSQRIGNWLRHKHNPHDAEDTDINTASYLAPAQAILKSIQT